MLNTYYISWMESWNGIILVILKIPIEKNKSCCQNFKGKLNFFFLLFPYPVFFFLLSQSGALFASPRCTLSGRQFQKLKFSSKLNIVTKFLQWIVTLKCATLLVSPTISVLGKLSCAFRMDFVVVTAFESTIRYVIVVLYR